MKLFSHLPGTCWLLLLIGALLRMAAIEWRPEGAVANGPDEGEYLRVA